MKGNVVFFNTIKGFGKVLADDKETEVFVHHSDVNADSKVLVEGEEITFDIEKNDKGFAGKNVKRSIVRKAGVIVDYEMNKGWGWIESEGSRYWFHHSNVTGQAGFKKIDVDFSVEFTPGGEADKPTAEMVVCIDTRRPLDRFAYLGNWDEKIQELAVISPEEWDYLNDKTGKHPVLDSYIYHTFNQLLREDKIEYADDKGKPRYAAFNTGLVTIKQEEIFAYFEKNNPPSPTYTYLNLESQKWRFLRFERESDRVMSHFRKRPELTNYFDDPTELIYDTSRRLVPDYEHIVDDRDNRFPASFESLDKAQIMERLRSAIESALKRVRRNYKTAIPQYYHGGIQLLLPLCLEKPEKADLALVVARENEIYRANTILPLDWAYNNARLLAKPDREWLNP